MMRRMAALLAITMALAGAVAGSVFMAAPAAALPPECRPYPANCPDPLPPMTSVDNGRSIMDLANGCKREILSGRQELSNPTELLFILTVTVDYCPRGDVVEVTALSNTVQMGTPSVTLSISSGANSIRNNFTAMVVINSSRSFTFCTPKCFRARYFLFGFVSPGGVQADFDFVQLP
jgi:hypothetical protein